MAILFLCVYGVELERTRDLGNWVGPGDGGLSLSIYNVYTIKKLF